MQEAGAVYANRPDVPEPPYVAAGGGQPAALGDVAEEVEPRDEGPDLNTMALNNYEQFYQLPRGSAKLAEIQKSSAGIAGWARMDVGGDPHEASTDAGSSVGAGSSFGGSPSSAASDNERYEPLGVVGRGVYGTVLVARDRETNERVALKRISLDEDQGDGVPAHVVREVSLLRDFVHRNVVQLMDLQVMSLTEFQLVFEYVPDELHRIVKGHRRAGTQLPMARVLQYSQDLLRGIHACHQRLIIHRDLKPQNVLIHPVDGLKICDFGLARAFSQPVRQYTPEVITLWYRAPELLLGHSQYGPEVDIWSAGCIIAEMATSHPTFPGDSEIGTAFKIMQLLGSPTEATWPGFEQILSCWSPHFPRWPPTDLAPIRAARPELGEAGMDLLRNLLAMNPASRIKARRARDHAFLQPELQEEDAPAGWFATEHVGGARGLQEP
jgi:serine/threonine protein kinase